MSAKTWLDTLRPASFRGVAFEVDGADKTFGPRTITHEFPLRSDPTHEFLGNLPNTFSVEAILIGDDLMALMAQLDRALDEKSPGRLIHPWYGELDVVVVGEVRVRVNTHEGRVARYAIQFQLAGGDPSPLSTIDTAAAVEKASDDTLSAAVKDFTDGFTIDNLPDFVTDAARDAIGSMTQLSQVAFRGFNLSSLLANGGIGAGGAALLKLAPGDMADTGDLADRVLQFFRPNTGRVAPPMAVSNALLTLAAPSGLTAALPAVAGVTTSWQRIGQNLASLTTLFRLAAGVEAVRAGTAAGWESRDQAMAWRDQAGDNLDAIADRAGEAHWDATWQAATDLRAVMVRDVSTRAAPLPRLTTLRPPITLPAVAIAYRIDGDDLDGLFPRADDLRRRNRLRHPGFVPGGEALEVLLDAS